MVAVAETVQRTPRTPVRPKEDTHAVAPVNGAAHAVNGAGAVVTERASADHLNTAGVNSLEAPTAAPAGAVRRVIGRPFTKGHNLSRGRKPGTTTARRKEIRDLAQRMLNDKLYLERLKTRLKEGTAPHIEQLLYHYAYGKPADRVKLSGNLGTYDLVDVLQQVTALRGRDPRALAAANGGT